MTIEDSNKLRNSWKTTLLTSNKLTPFQIMDLENIKEDDKVNIELLDYHSLNSQLRQLFNDGKYDTIIARLSKLPIGKEDKISIKVKMPTGKTISYHQYLKIAESRMDNNQEPLEVEIISPKVKNLKKLYSDMGKEEYSKTIFGKLVYNNNMQIIQSNKRGFEIAWEELIAMIADEENGLDYFNPIKLSEYMNAHPCDLATLFYSEAVYFDFLQWLAENGHIDREVLKDIDFDLTLACSSMHQVKNDLPDVE